MNYNADNGPAMITRLSKTMTGMIVPVVTDAGLPVKVNWAIIPCVKLTAAPWSAMVVRLPQALLRSASAVRIGRAAIAWLSRAALDNVPTGLASRKAVR